MKSRLGAIIYNYVKWVYYDFEKYLAILTCEQTQLTVSVSKSNFYYDFQMLKRCILWFSDVKNTNIAYEYFTSISITVKVLGFLKTFI